MAKILIIEDEEVLLNVLKNRIEKEGYEVDTAQDGEIGLKKIEVYRPDLVLLDILMPKMDGMEVLAKLKEKDILPDLPIIVVSNSGQPVEIEKAMDMGVKDYLVKAEFDPQEVLDKIKKHLPSQDDNTEVQDSNASKTESGGSAADIKADNFRVLVVEDDKFLRDLMVQKIVKEGFEVIEAIDGEDGFKIAVEKQPHIILLDLILPGIDGFEVLQKIRQDEKIGDVPVVILSNLGQKDDIDKGKKLGATDYLIKAHNTPGEIVDKVKEILAKNY